MSEFSNMPAGSNVPETGKYRCEFCGEGGMAETIGRRFKETQRISLGNMEDLAKDRASLKTFQSGTVFPECENCGTASLWTLVQRLEEEEKPDDTPLWPDDDKHKGSLWSDD